MQVLSKWTLQLICERLIIPVVICPDKWLSHRVDTFTNREANTWTNNRCPFKHQGETCGVEYRCYWSGTETNPFHRGVFVETDH